MLITDIITWVSITKNLTKALPENNFFLIHEISTENVLHQKIFLANS